MKLITKPFDEIKVDLAEQGADKTKLALFYKGKLICWKDFPMVLPGDSISIKDIVGTVVLEDKEDG